MTREQLIDWVARRYGLTYKQASNVVDEHYNKRATMLDRVRQQQFNSKINDYSKAMQFA